MAGRNVGKSYTVDENGNHEMIGFGSIHFLRYHFICKNILSGNMQSLNGKPFCDEAKRAIRLLYGKGNMFEKILFKCLRLYILNHFRNADIRKRKKCVEFDEINKLFDNPEGEKK